MAENNIALMAHLMRRAGFGATREELEQYVAKGYETMVEELLHPENAPPALEDEDLIRRYHVDENHFMIIESARTYWMNRMVNTRRPLEEKLALFWHGVFATGFSKLAHPRVVLNQIRKFRLGGLGSFHNLLVEVSKDPAMIFWLDNNDNHMNGVNENYGREILELFSMGVGNYTEDDVRQCSRAFTGWTMQNASFQGYRSSQDSVWPYGRLDWQFQFLDNDHDHGEKTFLGNTGPFNGEDVIDIICRQPATARFIARHLYTFFVADEPQVPSWQTVAPRDPEAINTLVETFVKHDGEIRPVLRVLFNSDFFKNATFARVKSPAELVVGTARMVGGFQYPEVEDVQLALQVTNMGQRVLDPPSVEGWHTGPEWISTAGMLNRVNFAVQQCADVDRPGISFIINRIRARGPAMSPERLVDTCLDLIGPITLSEDTRRGLVDHASGAGEVRFGTEDEERSAKDKIRNVLQLIVSTPEYQLA